MSELMLMALLLFWAFGFVKKAIWAGVQAAMIFKGGPHGNLSWVLWGGAFLVGYVHGGVAISMAAGTLTGKIVTPLWIYGMTREAERRWPAFGQFLLNISPWCKLRIPTIVSLTLWAIIVVLILWQGI